MPVSSLIPAIIGSIIESAVDQATAPPPVPPGPAAGIIRTLPATSLVGDMMPPTAMNAVEIDGRMLAMAPGVQFRNEQNMIVLPTAIQQPVRVRYVTESTGAVWRVWVLTPAELAAAER